MSSEINRFLLMINFTFLLINCSIGKSYQFHYIFSLHRAAGLELSSFSFYNHHPSPLSSPQPSENVDKQLILTNNKTIFNINQPLKCLYKQSKKKKKKPIKLKRRNKWKFSTDFLIFVLHSLQVVFAGPNQ